MNRFSRTVCLALLGMLPVIGFGCVPQDRYDQLLMTNRSLQEQLMSMEAERDTALANINSVRNQLNRANAGLMDLQTQNDRLNNDLSRMAQDYDALLQRVASLEIGPLPADMESAIHALAAAYPDVLTFDAKRGLLRFASDFTFDLGSVALKPDAARTLQELSRILNTPNAANFEARIVGHTDNVRINRPETLRNHPTNVHLSVHRSISVRDAMVSAGVNAVRIQVAGYGEHRPLVPNRPGGTAENRRVEIFLLPMPPGIDLAPAAAPAAPSAAPAAPARTTPAEPMK
ncbi:MAG TPA: OmpA family protein [Phycisphaerales bacterium]|nr:OmpA family protein [Phycisphaerales bacterium]HRQ74769.1 OmpA family protein [Phycisphaerales bacterium]